MKTCMFTGMFRHNTFQEAVEQAAEIGYQGVEIRFALPHMSLDTDERQLEECGKIVQGNGLEAVSVYSFLGGFSTCTDIQSEQKLEEFRKLLVATELLQASMLKIDCGGPNAFLAEQQHFERAAHWIKACAAIAKPSGKKLILEIHNNSLIEDLDHAEQLIELIGEGNVGFIHDAGNMYITQTDFGVQSVQRLGSHLFHVHVKDVLRVSDSSLPDTFRNLTKDGDELFQLTQLNRGGANHLPLIRGLKDSGYTGYLSTEANLSMDSMAMARYEYDQLTAMLREVE